LDNLLKKYKSAIAEMTMTPLTKHIIPIIKAFKAIALIAMLCVLPTFGYSAARTATVAGNWSNTATWGGSAVPTSSDDVTITVTVTLDVDAQCKTIIINSNQTFTMGTHNLTVYGNATLNCYSAPTITTSGGYFIMDGTNGASSIIPNTNCTPVIPNLRLTNNATITCGQSLTVTNFDCQSGTSTFTNSSSSYGGGYLTVTGILTAPNCTFLVTNANVSAYNFSGITSNPGQIGGFTCNQTGSTFNFGSSNLAVYNSFTYSAGTLTTTGTISMYGTTLNIGAAKTITNFTIRNAGIIKSGTGILTISGTYDWNCLAQPTISAGSISATGSTINNHCVCYMTNTNAQIVNTAYISGSYLTNTTGTISNGDGSGNGGTITLNQDFTNSATLNNKCGSLITVLGAMTNSGTISGATTSCTWSRIENTATVTNTSGTIGASSSYIAFSNSIGAGGSIGGNVVQSSSQVATCTASNPTITISPSSSTICTGSGVSLTASGGTTYLWSTTATTVGITVSPTVTTTYTVTGTSAGCSGTGSVVVTVTGIPAAPTVTTPINYCQNATATQLSATGSSLSWTYANPNGSVGTTATLTGGGWTSSNITTFTTLKPNITINSVDWYLIGSNSASGLIISIQDATGATTYASSTSYSGSAGTSDLKVTATFSSCILASAGNYRISITGGNAQMRIVSSPSFPQTESTGSINITGYTTSQAFTNLQFTIPASSTAPTPSTTTVGSTSFLVTQTVSCVSPAATIVVNSNANASIASVTGSSTISNVGTAQYTANSVVSGGGTGTWSSSVTGVATVNSSGLVSAVSVGTSTIAYTITGGCGGTVSASQVVSVLLTSPTLIAASGATVDNPLTITFPTGTAWFSAGGTVVKYGSTTLTVTTDYTLVDGVLTLIPSGSAGSKLTAGTQTVTISKTGYLDATVSQTIATGAATKLAIKTLLAAPANNGAVLATQPAIYIQDQYGNTVSSSATVTANVASAGAWTLGGTNSLAAVSGTATFTNLTATSDAAVTGATIIFTCGSLTSITSATFNIPGPIVYYSIATGDWTTTATWSNVGCGSSTVASSTPPTGARVQICPGTTVTISDNNSPTISQLTVSGASAILQLNDNIWQETITVTGNTYIDNGGLIKGNPTPTKLQAFSYVFNNLLIGTNSTGGASAFALTQSSQQNSVTISGLLTVGNCTSSGTGTGLFNYSPIDTTGTASILSIANRIIRTATGTYTFGCSGSYCPTAPTTTSPACTPTLSASSASVTGFSYCLGSGPSASKTFTISGTELSGSGNITVSGGSTDYEVSTDNATFASTVTYAYASGLITSQPKTVYVRLKSGLAKGNYTGETITISGGGAATAATVSCSGTVSAAISGIYSILSPTTAGLVATGATATVLTVKAFDADSIPLTTGGQTVTISNSSGTGTIGAVTDNGDGTYSATVTSPVSTGSGIFVATIAGQQVKSGTGSQTQATIYYTTTPTQIVQNPAYAGSQTVFSGCTVTNLPSVIIKDASNNPVRGVTVTFAVGSGGGSVTGATQTTDVNGVATVGSWNLGTTGTNTLVVNAMTSSSTAPIQYPFPQSTHFHYPFGISASHPNYDSLQAKINRWILNYYEEGTTTATSYGTHGLACARIKWDNPDKTVSEGMAYGMLIFVYADNPSNNYQTKFDKLWLYYNNYKNNNRLMNWRVYKFDQLTSGDANGATDADLDVALSLIMAHKQWGSSGAINYLACANQMFHDVYQYEINHTNNILFAGDQFYVSNPSYSELFAIKLAADEQAASVLTHPEDNWTAVYAAMKTYITHYSDASTGLMPNWTDNSATGNSVVAPYPGSDKCGNPYNQGDLYGIDALRVPWRIAWDYSWYGSSESKAVTDKMANWLRIGSNGPGNDPKKVLGMYKLDGSRSNLCTNIAGTVNGMGYIGGFTHAFMTGTDQTSLDNWYEYIQDTVLAQTTTNNPNYTNGTNGVIDPTFTDYYNHTLQILYLLTTSGNTPNFYSTNPVVQSVPLTFTSTAVSTVYSKNNQDLSNTTNWTINTDGTGLNPCNFTTSGTTFIVQSAHKCPFNSNTAFGSGVTVQVLGTITPTSSVVVSGAGTLNGSGTVVVTRTTSSEDNFDNQYSISNRTISGLTVQYAGSTNQTISNAHAFNNLTINNTTVVNQSVDQTVSGNLTMTSGILSTGTSIVDLGATGSILESTPNAYAPTSFVVGKVQATRNIGSSVNQTFGGIGMEINETNAANSTVVLRTTGTACVASGHHSITRYFTITPNVDAGLNGAMVFHYFDHELAGHIEANLQIWKSIDNRVTWSGQNSSVFVGTNTLTLGSIASFSDWTATDPVSNPLPISLLDFSAKQKNDAVDLFWKTASEVNNDYFVLERSIDGVNWEEIYTCKGAGTSTIINHYSFVDYEIQSSTVYYKLKQIDFDGKCSYSNILSVTNNIQPSRISVYPNPFDGRNIYITGLCDKEFAINIYDILGKSVYTTNIKLDGEVVVILDLDKQLPVGSYIIKLQSADQVFIQHLMVGKRD